MLSPSQIIVVATPVFLALMAVEWVISLRRGRNAYALADAISSLNLGILSQSSAVFTKLLTLGIYTAVASHVALLEADAFWMSLPGWLLALVFYDFCYYWLHRMATKWACSGRRTPCITRVRPTTSRRRCARPARVPCWAGFSIYPWPWLACRRWCLPWSG